MAYFNSQVERISRGKVSSIMSCLSYRTGDHYRSKLLGISYSNKRQPGEILHHSVIGFPGTSQELWWMVEKVEKRCDALEGIYFMCSLPKELGKDGCITLGVDLGEKIAEHWDGIPVDTIIQNEQLKEIDGVLTGNGNFTAHYYLCSRIFSDGEFSKTKNRNLHGKRFVFEIRKLYETVTNAHLERNGFSERISGERNKSAFKKIHHDNDPDKIRYNANIDIFRKIEVELALIDSLLNNFKDISTQEELDQYVKTIKDHFLKIREHEKALDIREDSELDIEKGLVNYLKTIAEIDAEFNDQQGTSGNVESMAIKLKDKVVGLCSMVVQIFRDAFDSTDREP